MAGRVMLMAKHLLRGKVEKFMQFRAYLKDSSKFVFSLPEPRAWPDGKSVGNSDGESGGGDSGGSNSSGVVSRPKVINHPKSNNKFGYIKIEIKYSKHFK